MSRYFVLPEENIGPGGDIIFRKHGYGYLVCVGEARLGMVTQLPSGWSGLSYAPASRWFSIRSLDGFASRLTAAQFVIKHHGYWMRSERESRALAEKVKP